MKNYPFSKEMHALDGVEPRWWGFETSNIGEYYTHPLAIAVDNIVYSVEEGLKKASNALLNNRFVVNSARSVIWDTMYNVDVLRASTHKTVRLFMKEGKQLSHRSDLRMTWYTNPLTASEIGDYIRTDTGKMVYLDIELNILSEFSHRFYNVGNEAYALQGDLIKWAKRSWKYATDTDIAKSIVYLTHLQVAAGEENA